MREIYKYSNMATQKSLDFVVNNYVGNRFSSWSGNTPPTFNQFGNQAMYLLAQQYWQENRTSGTKEDFKVYVDNTQKQPVSTGITPTQETDTEDNTGGTGFNQESAEERIAKAIAAAMGAGNGQSGYLGVPTEDAISGSPMMIEGQETWVEGKATYEINSEYSKWNEFKTSKQINDVKYQLWLAGFYPDGVAPKLDGFKSESDFAAMRRGMNFANANTRTIEQVMMERSSIGAAQGKPYRDVVSESMSGDSIMATPQRVITDMNDPYYQLQDFIGKNNISVSEEWLMTNADRIREKGITLDSVKQYMRQKYISKQYPAWADDILSGKDVYEIAEPYISEYARTLEVDRNSVKLSDPYIMRALDNVDANGKPSYLPMADFKQMLKSDDAWFFTGEAKSQYTGLANRVLQSFGIKETF